MDPGLAPFTAREAKCKWIRRLLDSRQRSETSDTDPAVIERCAGIDVGKREIAVAVITGPADQDGEMETRAFGTTVLELEKLRDWLAQAGCTSVAVGSTGSDWSPIKDSRVASADDVLVWS